MEGPPRTKMVPYSKYFVVVEKTYLLDRDIVVYELCLSTYISSCDQVFLDCTTVLLLLVSQRMGRKDSTQDDANLQTVLPDSPTAFSNDSDDQPTNEPAPSPINKRNADSAPWLHSVRSIRALLVTPPFTSSFSLICPRSGPLAFFTSHHFPPSLHSPGQAAPERHIEVEEAILSSI